MLEGFHHNGTGDMEVAKESKGRGGDGVCSRKPDGDGGTIP